MRRWLLNKFVLMSIILMPMAVLAQSEPDATEDSTDKIEVQASPAAGAYGYISFTILPGFKSIRLDRETVVGMSEMILVPEGSHWIEITSPEGYADSSFKISVEKGEVVKKEIRLRSEVDGIIANGSSDKKSGKKQGIVKKVLMYTSFTLGGLATISALNENGKFKDAKAEYNGAGPTEPPEVFDELASDIESHEKQRNGMVGLSVLSFGLGLVLLFF